MNATSCGDDRGGGGALIGIERHHFGRRRPRQHGRRDPARLAPCANRRAQVRRQSAKRLRLQSRPRRGAPGLEQCADARCTRESRRKGRHPLVRQDERLRRRALGPDTDAPCGWQHLRKHETQGFLIVGRHEVREFEKVRRQRRRREHFDDREQFFRRDRGDAGDFHHNALQRARSQPHPDNGAGNGDESCRQPVVEERKRCDRQRDSGDRHALSAADEPQTRRTGRPDGDPRTSARLAEKPSKSLVYITQEKRGHVYCG